MILGLARLPPLDVIRAVITLVLTYLRSIVLKLCGGPTHLSSTRFLRILLRVAVLLREAFVFVIIVVLQGCVMRAVSLSRVRLGQHHFYIIAATEVRVRHPSDSIG